MKIKRKGSAAWQGGIKDGKGSISTESGALNAYPYGFASRFEGQKGSYPEELIAAAHAQLLHDGTFSDSRRGQTDGRARWTRLQKSLSSRSKEAGQSQPCI